MTEQEILGLFVLIGAVITAVLGSRSSKNKSLIEAQMARMDGLEERVAALEDDKRVLTDYAHELREHISDEKPPPPPPWPLGLGR